MSVKVRPMTIEELQPALELFSSFGLNESLSIAQSYFISSPEQFYVAINEGERSFQVVGACASPLTSKDSAFLGLYVVDKKFQGQGLGVQLFDSCIKSLNGLNCGLSAIPAKYSIYKNKAGFKVDGGSSLMIFSHSPIDVQSLRGSQALHKFNRKMLLYDSLRKSDTFIVSVYDESRDGQIMGYGLIRPDITGASMPGPVYAEKPEIGEIIMRKLFESATEHGQNAQRGNVAIYCNSEAIDGMKMLQNTLGMKAVDQCRKLYTEFVPEFDYSKVFCVHTPDFSC